MPGGDDRRWYIEPVREMPVEVQPIVKALGTTAYAAYARDLYGTAAPPRVTG